MNHIRKVFRILSAGVDPVLLDSEILTVESAWGLGVYISNLLCVKDMGTFDAAPLGEGFSYGKLWRELSSHGKELVFARGTNDVTRIPQSSLRFYIFHFSPQRYSAWILTETESFRTPLQGLGG